MEIVSEEIAPLKFRMVCVSDKEDIKAKSLEAIETLRKVKTPGFRQGKAPDNVIRVKFKKQINEYVKNQLVQQAYDDAIFKWSYKPIGNTNVDKIDFNGKEFKCEFVLGVCPKVELNSYRDFSIQEPEEVCTVEEKKNEFLTMFANREGGIEPYTESDFIEKGDQVTLDIVVHDLNGDPSDMSEEGVFYSVGEEARFGQEFNENILGMSMEETREFESSVGGQVFKFKVTFHMGTKRVPAEINEEFAQKLGAKDLEELNKSFLQWAEKTLADEKNAKIKDLIIDHLVENNKVDIPDWLVDDECIQMIHSAINAQMEGQKTKAEVLKFFKGLDESVQEQYKKAAILRLKTDLILDEIRSVEPETSLTENESINYLANVAAAQGKNPNEFLVKAKESGMLNGYLQNSNNQYVLNWIFKNIKLEGKVVENE